MSKLFGVAIAASVVILIIFSLFIFGIIGGQPASTGVKQIRPTKPMTQTFPQNLKIQDIKVGTGPEVKSGDTVVINYTGTLTDGTKFDSSFDHGQPFETQIGVGQVIKGWDLGVVGMKVGGERKLTIPPDLGYGNQSAGSIPPNSTLIFDVQLVGIK